ncbi:interleukin-1 family member 10 isoform X2 [Marmota monax]|uniref:interleukin-1 family member 10 isoform X2 n=1 Tax=Marmota monax TaxID=9995 RepID=UPI0026E9B74B|nr:interleukin-1 family member 10 isoform X2 [Marmota monax]
MCSLPMAKYYIIKDADQKALYTRDGQLLVGDPDTDDCSAEKICVLPNRDLDRAKVPILLGLQGGSRCLACVQTEEGPSLQLEGLGGFGEESKWTDLGQIQSSAQRRSGQAEKTDGGYTTQEGSRE